MLGLRILLSILLFLAVASDLATISTWFKLKSQFRCPNCHRINTTRFKNCTYCNKPFGGYRYNIKAFMEKDEKGRELGIPLHEVKKYTFIVLGIFMIITAVLIAGIVATVIYG